jgi:hypothetical protein
LVILGVLKAGTSLYHNRNWFLILLFLYYLYSVGDILGIFDKMKDYIKLIQADQKITLGHKKYEFEYFYVLEKQSIICLILIFGMQGVYSSIPFFENFNLFLDPSNGELLLNLKAYIFSFIFTISIVNLIIIHLFNPGQGLKLAATCIGCVWGGISWFST